MHPSIEEHIVRLRNAGFEVREIAEDLGLPCRRVEAILIDNGVRFRKLGSNVDMDLMRELWQTDATLMEIGVALGVSVQTVLRLAKRHHLPSRSQTNEFGVSVSEDEETASAESLRLSPWVQARIRELGLGMPV